MAQRFAELARRSPSELEELMRDGRPIALESLHDAMWHGYSLAMPSVLFKLFGLFGKTFVHDAGRGVVRGWNVRMRQGTDWTPATVRGRVVTYGHYHAVAEPPGPLADRYPNAFLIDYGRGGNHRWDPLARVRDWMVALDDELLLGRMYLALAGRDVPTPSYFALARGEGVDHVVEPPRSS